MIIRHSRAVSQGKQGLFWGGAAGGLPSPSSLTRVHLPQRGRQDLVFCKPLVGCPLRPLRGHSRLPARSSAERCPLGTSAPQRGRRDLALRKLLAAHILGSPFGAATSRWDVAQRPVSAAASVGDGRSPLGCITRGGSRDAGTALAVTERARRRLAAQLPGSHLLGAPPAGKGGAKPLFP